MTNILPYVIPAVIAIVFFIALRLHARATGKALSRAEERLATLETQSKNNPNSELDEIRKSITDKDLVITQLREEMRSALDSLAEATRKKFVETEASEKAHRDQIIEKVTTLLKSSIRRPEQKPEPSPTVQPVRENSAHEKAKRLARLIVSDIVLYNQAAVEEGIRNNTFAEVMANDIQEARTLYAQRVPEEIRQQTTYLDEAFADLIARKKQELNLA